MAKNEKLYALISCAQCRPPDTGLFRTVIRAAIDERVVEDIDLASELAVSRSTVERWKNGKAAPHPAMRAPVYAVLIRRLRGMEALAARPE